MMRSDDEIRLPPSMTHRETNQPERDQRDQRSIHKRAGARSLRSSRIEQRHVRGGRGKRNFMPAQRPLAKKRNEPIGQQRTLLRELVENPQHLIAESLSEGSRM